MAIAEKSRMTFGKKEHIVSRKLIDRLFEGGNRSMVAFPLRMVYMAADDIDVPVQVLVSVSKRHFKRAVKRNRVKRQIREAYRHNKHVVTEKAVEAGHKYAVSFIYLANDLYPSATINESMEKLMSRLAEKIEHKHQEAEKDKSDNEKSL